MALMRLRLDSARIPNLPDVEISPTALLARADKVIE
jgi:hypothetical protein